jgi:hypothetical protein
LLCFRKDKFAYRTHQLGPYARVAEVYEDAQRSLKKYGVGTYEFANALRLLERGVRIPEFVEHLISENDFAEILKHVTSEAQLVPEKRDLARRVVQKGLCHSNPTS